MKRVLLLVILTTIAKIVGIFYLGAYLFTDRPELEGECIAFHHVWPFVLSAFFLLFIVIHIIGKFLVLMDMYHEYNPPGLRFETTDQLVPITFTGFKASIYNNIDTFDFTPMINKFKHFWGY